MRVRAISVGLALLMATSLLGCPVETGKLQRDALAVQHDASRTVTERINELEDTISQISTRAFCPEELQSLLLRIYQDCGRIVCRTEQVQAMVTLADPKQRFMRLMKDVPHVVVYSSKAQPISPQRRIQLEWMLAPPWPSFARVLIIARSKSGESDLDVQQRAMLVRKQIRELQLARIEDFQSRRPSIQRYQIPDKMLILPLYYDFPLNLSLKLAKRDKDLAKIIETLSDDIADAVKLEKSVILDRDKPLKDEPQDTEKGVWIFLLNCRLAAEAYTASK